MNPEPQTAPLKILLADDDIDDRLFFARALKEIPIACNLIAVSDGEKLMDYLDKNSEELPDILFLDLSMPRKTGFECLSEIKENEKMKNIPVFVFTISFPHNEEFENNIKNMLSKIGANDYINKTSNLAELKEIIHKALIKVTASKLPNKNAEN